MKRSTLYEELLSRIGEPGLSAVSFDCFDTLLLRRVADPKDAFLLTHARCTEEAPTLRSLTPYRFRRLRISAELEARRLLGDSIGSPEVTISEIYQAFPDWIPAHEIQRALEWELEVEARLIRTFDPVAAVLKKAKRQGLAVVVTSDTYFSERHLTEFLDAELLEDIDFIFCSCEYRSGKEGELFDVVLKRLSAQADELLHIGDNYKADIVGAARRGIRSFHIPNGNPHFREIERSETRFSGSGRFEHLDPEQGDFGLRSLRAKSRIHRDCGEEFDHFDYGAQVLGPLFAGFCSWVRESVEAKRLDAAVFVYREGPFLLNLTTRMFGEQLGWRVLYASRMVGVQAQIASRELDRFTQLLWGRERPTVRQLTQMLGLAPEDFEPLGYKPNQRLLFVEDMEPIVELLTTDTKLWRRVEEHLSQVRSGLLRQFRELKEQVGVSGNRRERLRVAYVDTGWSGTAQRHLQKVLDESDMGIDLVGLYVLTQSAVDRLDEQIESYGYLVDGGMGGTQSPKDPGFGDVIEILELTAMARTGSVVGFNKVGEPVLGPCLCPEKQLDEIETIRSGVTAFADIWTQHCEDVDATTGRFRRHLIWIFERAMLRPLPFEVSLFQDWVHDDTLRNVVEPIIPADFVSLSRYMSVRDFASTGRERVYWLGGAAALADPYLAHLHMGVATDSVDPELEGISPLCECLARVQTDKRTYSEVIPVVRNRSGLSYVRIEKEWEAIHSVELEWSVPAALLRFDQLVLSSRTRNDDGILQTCFLAEQLSGKLEVAVENDFGAGVYSISDSSRITIPLDRLYPEKVDWIRLEVCYLIVEVPETLLEVRTRSLAAVESRGSSGGPRLIEKKELIRVGRDEAAEVCRVLQDELVAAKKQTQDVKNAWSWRLTAPLRWVGAGYLRLRR